MGLEKVTSYLARYGLEDQIKSLNESTATVALAAEAIGVEEARIAKTISFYDGADRAILIVAAGDAKVDNKKFKTQFGQKAKMLKGDDVERLTGFRIGGVCPFAVQETASVYLDESLKRFDTVYPACGTASSMVKVTLPQLEEAAQSLGWVDVCKSWQVDE